MIDTDAVIKSARELEPLPTSVSRLASLVAGPDPDVDAIVETVALDQSLTLRFLRLANAAYGASRTRITTVREAVLRLGVGRLLSFTMGTFVQSRMCGPLQEYDMEAQELWCHSVASALATEMMSSVSKLRFPAEVFTTALLHDVGKLVLCRFLRPDVLSILHEARRNEPRRAGWYESEREVLMVDHGEIGGLVAQHWQLPESMVKGIIHHHNPEEGGTLVCHAIHLADIIAHAIESSDDELDDLRQGFEKGCRPAEIVPSSFDSLRLGVARNYAGVMSSYGAAAETRAIAANCN